MKRFVLATLFFVLLGAQTCEPSEPPPEGGTAYCHGRDYTILEELWAGVEDLYDTIIGGIASTDRRATVKVYFGQSYCSGVALSPHTVLTAGHCGYAPTTTHEMSIEGGVYKAYKSTEHLVHPGYLRYLSSGNTDLEGRKSDLMLIFLNEDTPLPPPYVDVTTRIYHSGMAEHCSGLIAQGYGRAEAELPQGKLREAEYLITQEQDKLLVSKLTDAGKICFGDSGGPLYADVEVLNKHQLHLAGITTTTMSQDCLTGGSHVKLMHADHIPWLINNVRP